MRPHRADLDVLHAVRHGLVRHIHLIDLTARAGDGQFTSLPAHRDGNHRALLAAQQLGYLGICHRGRIRPVHRDNDIADCKTGLLRRGKTHHLGDLHTAYGLLHAHTDADEALHGGKALRVLLARQIHRMRIQQGEDVV